MAGRRGRPPVSETEPSVSVSVRLPVSCYDRVYADAQRRRTTVAQLLRDRVAREFCTQKSENVTT